ncbi:unnamed protein product [Acanthoscelides obtectus]|uniref:Uncharacterized protein n=1 Tax=Acanthoscelides obtectus TaxID=200917 RepID=A0A9P0PWN4_ACAOB|nr:unnamed protein product [Acanthoscelides obtectus]CAK1665601.1 hypothetical protein AOBTE_LOCUS24893 [Acanthoscelides obtectus]
MPQRAYKAIVFKNKF